MNEESKMNLLFKAVRVIDPASGLDAQADVLVEGGKIKEISSSLPEAKVTAPGKVINFQDKILVPGLIDMHCHLREPGHEYKETIETGSKAAAAGGYTSIVCMANTLPVNDCRAVTEYILRQARDKALVNVYPVGAVTKGLKGESLAEIGDMREAGIVAVSDDGQPVMNSSLFRRALEYAAGLGLPVISHCEDLNLRGQGVMNEGYMSTILGLRGIPKAAEVIMVQRDIILAELTGATIHIAHVSAAESVQAIREAKKRGVKVTAETAPHYFSLTDESVRTYNTNTKMNPPLRTAADVAAIIAGLQDGTLDAIATDHAPQSPVEKDVEFDYAANGIIGLETALPLTLTLVHQGHLSLMKALEKLTCQPARILNLPGGKLQVGASADLTLIDLNREYTVDINKFKSKSRNSPFHGWQLKGKAIMTIVSGRIVYSED
jgi:dihydroorotase